jgi:hypothetical protein
VELRPGDRGGVHAAAVPDWDTAFPALAPVAALELVATAITLAGVAVQPGLVGLPAPGGTSATVVNPFGVTSIGPLPTAVLNGTLNGVGVLAGLMQIAACAALVIRYHFGEPVQRQQIKWITLLAVVFAIFQGTAVLGIEVTGDPSNPVTTVAYLAVPVLALFGLPAVLTLAILKHGLYQIDVILNRAVKYGLLSASLTAVYAGIVLGIGTLAGYAGGPVLTVAAAVVIAALIQPARARAQHVANRLIYGPRATPTRCWPISPRTWPASWTWMSRWTGWRRYWPPPSGRTGWTSGSG